MTKKYGVILADPPWRFENQSWRATMPEEQVVYERGTDKHYPSMSIDDICDLPIVDCAAENSVLFLWATWPHIQASFDVINAWGFEYRTIAWVWAKMNPSSMGFHMGLGYYTRSNTEPCLLAVRGSMVPTAKDVMALIVSPIRQHSRKPDEQYGKIARLYPNESCLELFARRPHPGWDVWGNEVDSDIDMVMIDKRHET